jgi:DNA-binding response OmpR family regulator
MVRDGVRVLLNESPIVVVSAVQDARRIARDLGAAAFIPKPFSVDELAEVVQRVTPAPDTRPSYNVKVRPVYSGSVEGLVSVLAIFRSSRSFSRRSSSWCF